MLGIRTLLIKYAPVRVMFCLAPIDMISAAAIVDGALVLLLVHLMIFSVCTDIMSAADHNLPLLVSRTCCVLEIRTLLIKYAPVQVMFCLAPIDMISAAALVDGALVLVLVHLMIFSVCTDIMSAAAHNLSYIIYLCSSSFMCI